MRKLISAIGIAFLALHVAGQTPGTSLPDLYGQLTGRTVLYGALPAMSIKGAIPTDTNQAIKVIEGELAKHQIECIRGGDKFVTLLPASWKNTVDAPLAKLTPPTNSPGKVPAMAGEISFPAISIEQVLDIYSQLSKRTLLHPVDLPPVMLHFKSQGPLTTDEVIYAFKTLFILNGFVIVDDGEKSEKLVPISQIKK